MDAACTIQDSIHVFSLVHKYVSRILGTYQRRPAGIFLLEKGEGHGTMRETGCVLAHPERKGYGIRE